MRTGTDFGPSIRARHRQREYDSRHRWRLRRLRRWLLNFFLS